MWIRICWLCCDNFVERIVLEVVCSCHPVANLGRVQAATQHDTMCDTMCALSECRNTMKRLGGICKTHRGLDRDQRAVSGGFHPNYPLCVWKTLVEVWPKFRSGNHDYSRIMFWRWPVASLMRREPWLWHGSMKPRQPGWLGGLWVLWLLRANTSSIHNTRPAPQHYSGLPTEHALGNPSFKVCKLSLYSLWLEKD